MKSLVVVVCLLVGTVLLFWGLSVAQVHVLTGFTMAMVGLGLWSVAINIAKP